MAVQADGHIAAVGTDTTILPLQQSTTIVQNMAGAFVMPVSLAHIMCHLQCSEFCWQMCMYACAMSVHYSI